MFKKDPDEPDDYNGVVSYPEPDILQCEVKWAMEFQLSYLKS